MISRLQRFAEWVDDRMPSAMANESPEYKQAAKDVKQFLDDPSEPLVLLLAKQDANELATATFEFAKYAYEDAEKDRDRAASRADKVLVAVSIVAGVAFTTSEGFNWLLAISSAFIGIAAAVAVIARRSGPLIGPTSALDSLKKAADGEVETVAHWKVLMQLQLHRSTESIVAANVWTNRMVSLSSIALIISFVLITLSRWV